MILPEQFAPTVSVAFIQEALAMCLTSQILVVSCIIGVWSGKQSVCTGSDTRQGMSFCPVFVLFSAALLVLS